MISSISSQLPPPLLKSAPQQGGGSWVEPDRVALLEMGVVAVFGPGALTSDVIEKVSTALPSRS